MLEDRDNKSLEEETRELNASLYRLAHTKFIQSQFELANGTWMVRPGQLPMDIAFLKKGSSSTPEEASFVGMRICGKENVIGIHLQKGKNAVQTGLKILEENPRLEELAQRGARVLVLTPKDLRAWCGFYEQIEKTGVMAALGERSLEFSGLEWATEKEQQAMDKSLSGILHENWEYLNRCGVSEITAKDGSDLTFVDENGITMAVPIHHLRDREQKGEIVIEQIISEARLCAGMVIQRVGETERHLAERAREVQEIVQAKFQVPISIAMVNYDQVNLWEKLGLADILRAVESGSTLTPEEVVRFLYLGESNVNPGILARSPSLLSLPGQGDAFAFPGVDIVFSRKRQDGARVMSSVDNWLVLDRKGQEVPLSNVAGIKIFPSGMSFEEMKIAADPIRKDFAHRAGLPGAYILNLTPELFAKWKMNGSPFFNRDKQLPAMDIKKQHEYFMPGSADKAYYFQYRQKTEIGGNKNGLMLVDGSGNKVTHLFDVGLGFSDMPKGFNGIGKEPNTADGLLRLFRQGVLPMVPGWWEKEYIFQTAIKMTGLSFPNFVKGDVVAQYVVAELFARSTPDEMKAKLPESVYQNVMRMGQEMKDRVWGVGDRLIETATPTHPHADHISLFSYLDSDIRMILSGPTAGFFNAITQKAGTWRRRLTDRKLLTEPMIGGAYQTESVNIESYFNSGARVRLSSQVTLEPWFVTHSVPATWQLYNVRTRNGGSTTVFNSGDWNVDKTRRVFSVAEKLSGKPDVIIMEATNMGSGKAYVGKNEGDVRDTFLSLVKNSQGEAIVCVAPINNLSRLKSLMDVAESTGRKLALSYPHAELALQLAAAKKRAPLGAEGFEDVLPHGFGQDVLTLWTKQMTSPRAMHKALIDIASAGNLGVLDHERLSKENDKWIVVVSPFDVLEDQFDGLNLEKSMKVVWMSSFPHEDEQRYFIGANNAWMRRSGKIKFVADMEVLGQGGRVSSKLGQSGVLHVSGHASAEEMVAITEILAGSDRKNIPVIINHSQNPELAGRMLVARLGDKVRPVTHLDRYDPGDPSSRPGFFFPLF